MIFVCNINPRMRKIVLSVVGIFIIALFSFGQSPGNILFVIDSIPVLNNPESWNQVTQDDIADVTIIKNRDSLKLLGWAQMDAIMYIFTKPYRNRPDSIKEIASLKQMVFKNDVWTLHDTVYSGKYIDYYNNGNIENEGSLLNGKLNGCLTVYYKNGNKRSITNFINGERDGISKEYYKNGMLLRIADSSGKKQKTDSKTYFINGQVWNESSRKNSTPYDTFFTYYSTGKVKEARNVKNGVFYPDKKQSNLAYYTTMFNQNINTGEIKSANKNFYQIWLLDSTSADSHFLEGLLMYVEFRFDRAIEAFDNALTIEPLMRESLTYRALARIKAYKFQHSRPSEKDNNIPVALEDIEVIPTEEMAKVCSDIQLAREMDTDEIYIDKRLPEFLFNFCMSKK